MGAYGGGQYELGVGRGQIQYLAAIFHPDAPNDIAPAGYDAHLSLLRGHGVQSIPESTDSRGVSTPWPFIRADRPRSK